MEYKNLNVPDYHNLWEEKFNSIKPELENHLKDKTELTINISNSPLKDLIEIKKNPNYIPNNLIEITNSISTKYINDEFIEFILNNLSEDIEVLNVPGEFLSRIDLLSMFPKLREIKITNYYELTKEDILNVKNNTNINKIESFNFTDLFSEFDENAIYHDGKKAEIKFLDKDLNIVKNNIRITAIANNFYVNDLNGNVDDVIQFIKENGINIHELEYFNIISSQVNEDYISYNLKDKEMEYCGNIEVFRSILEKLNTIGLIPNKIFLKLENKDYDFSSLRGIKLPIEIDYGEPINASIDEFITMRETINYYKNLITSSNLSPLEQVTYAYDIIKSFEFKEADDLADSRIIHKIIKSGKIVCIGYSLFLEQVLSELGFRITDFSVNCRRSNGTFSLSKTNHRKNLIRIDDDKYNVHMIATLDATWDSIKNERNLLFKNSSEILEESSNLISYLNFLIPKNEYLYRYDEKTYPPFFTVPPHIITNVFDLLPRIVDPQNAVDEATSYYQFFFDKDGGPLIEQYLNADRPSYEVFKEVVKNVKYAEGYGKESEEIANNILFEKDKIKTR